MIDRARSLAVIAHSYIDQRKYTNDQYIVHPINVAYLVELFGGTNEMISAAYLHDVIEDVFPKTDHFNDLTIASECGAEVLILVRELTDESKKEDGNRERRKEIDRLKLSTVSPQAKTIKVADLIDNCISIVKHDINFARIYLKEKEKLLEILQDCSHPKILNLAEDILQRSKKLLENK